MSYLVPMGATTVVQTPIIMADGSQGPTPAQTQGVYQAACQKLGGRWLNTFGGSYCEGSDGKAVSNADLSLVAQSETIEVHGTAPVVVPTPTGPAVVIKKPPATAKAFPWKPVLIGGGVLLVFVLIATMKPSAAPAAVTA